VVINTPNTAEDARHTVGAILYTTTYTSELKIIGPSAGNGKAKMRGSAEQPAVVHR
jgi:hypothetical protein